MVGPVLAIAGYLCILAVLAYALLRQVYLAALTVVVPPCLFASILALPDAWRSLDGMLGLFLTPICMLFIYDRASRSICMGAPARHAVASALKEIAAAMGPILVAYMLWLLLLAPEWTASGASIADAVTVAVIFYVSLGLGAIALWLPYTEDFIARANAARERRERLFERPTGLSETRWSLSVSGIALVLAAVALFGIRGLHVQIDWHAAEGFAASAALLAAAFAAIARNWRLTLAATLAASFVALLVLWMYARIDAQSFARFDLWLSVALELIVMSVPVLGLSRYVNRGETPASAIAMMLREQGPATSVAFLVLGAGAVAGSALFKQFWLVDFMPVLAGFAAALLFFPAFGNTFYWLLPRYRSVDEVFGKR